MIANNSSHFPYQACLIPNLPKEIQHQVRDITNNVVQPLGMLLAVMSFVCNSLVVVTVTRKKYLQSPSLLMLSSLSLIDLIYSLYSILRDIEVFTHEHKCPKTSSEHHGLSALCLLTILANLAIISRDRYLAVRKPLWYRNHVTKSRAITMISVAWLMSILIALLVYLRSKLKARFIPAGHLMCLSFYTICFFVIVLSYLGIFLKKNQLGDSLQIRAILEREKRVANTVALILFVLLLTFLPALVCPLALHAAGASIKPFRPFYTFFLQLNVFLNPLLNFGRSKDMRKGLKELLKFSRQVQPSAASGHLEQNASEPEHVDIHLDRVSKAN